MSENSKDKQYHLMRDTNIKKLVVKLAIPTTITMLVTSLYSIVDTYFVSQLGTSQSAAVGLVYPILAIMQAIGFTIGMGSGNKISRAMGLKDDAKADVIGSTAYFSALIFGFVLMVVGLLFQDVGLNLLGCTATAYEYTKTYYIYMLISAPFFIASFVINNLLRYVGKAMYAMIGIGFGTVLNIFLDWFLIVQLQMGVEGAAIATAFSQFVSFALLSMCYVLKFGVLDIRIYLISKIPADYLDIFTTGMPSMCRQGFAAISTVLLNHQAALYGDDVALSALSIVAKVFNLVFCVALGIGQGFQPVISFNYGAKLYRRSTESILFTAVLCGAVLTSFGWICYQFAPQILPLFINDDAVVALGIRMLRMQSFAMPFLTINIMANMTFQATGRKVKATSLACLRQGLVFIPCILILPQFMQLSGVIWTQPISDGLTALISLPFIVQFVKQTHAQSMLEGI